MLVEKMRREDILFEKLSSRGQHDVLKRNPSKSIIVLFLTLSV